MVCLKQLYINYRLDSRENKVVQQKFRVNLLLSFIFAFFMFLVYPTSTLATNYYVDATNGDDNDNGTSTDTPWQTINKVNISSFSAGDQILFKKGEIWREQLTVPSSGTAGNPIVFGAYSSGVNPIINGSDVVSSWTADIASYQTTFDMDGWGCWGNYSTASDASGVTYRTSFLQSAFSGSSIRITVKAAAGGSVTIDNSSVCIANGGWNDCDSTPTRITWDGGNNSATISAGASKTSDPITFSWSTSNINAVSVYVSSGSLVGYYSTVPAYLYRYTYTGDVALNQNMLGDENQINDSEILKVETSTGLANVWNATVADTPNQVFKDGVLATKGASKAALTQSQWYASGTTLSYYESAGNPGSQAYAIEASTRDYGIYFNGQNKITVDGLTVTKANLYGINIGHDSSHTLDNAIVQNSLVQYSYDAGIFSWVPTSLNGSLAATILNNEVSYNAIQDGIDGGNAPTGIEILGSNSTGPTLVQGNNIHHNYWGMEFDQNSDHSTAQYNSIHDNNKMGMNIDNSDNNTFQYNLVYNHPVSWGLRIWDAAANGMTGNVVYNNVFYGNSIGIIVENEQTNLKIKNNILLANTANTSTSEITLESGHTYTGLDIDYNSYYRESGTTYWKYGATNYSFTDWKTNSGQDANSVNSDPLFTDATGYDFTLQSVSPVINSGTDVSLTTDYAGTIVPQGTTPDIGAYEFSLPSSASSLLQYQSDGTSSISTGGKLGSGSTVVLKSSMSSANSSDSLTPQFEVRPVGTAFSNSATHLGNAISYSGTSVIGNVTVSGLGAGNYHWQARVDNPAGQSSWVSYGGNSEDATDFSIDYSIASPAPCNDSAPTSAPWLYAATVKGKDAILLQFTQAKDPVSEYVVEYGEESGKYVYAMADIGGKGTTSYTVGYLQPNKIFYFRVRAGNGCATGLWSNEISAKTLSGSSTASNDEGLETEIIETEIREREVEESNEEIKKEEQPEVLGVDVRLKVVNEEKEPIKGAKVTLYSEPREVTTNKDGISLFENVEPGDHKVVIAYNGQTGEQNINIQDDSGIEEVDFTIQLNTTSPFKDSKVIAVVSFLVLVVIVLVILFAKKSSNKKPAKL
ncbi:MAG TPA: right-handed parallel beta-helix repeat-containing protein [Patescibacteria group bacterium]|nr:right-handed parallel beta-helix repeat-containing protein [Patescibacteria group bacterium]